MVGRSWHPGCPVGRSSLRLVQVNYWDYDGYRRRGEMVVNADVVGSFTGAFTELHQRRLPVRAMYRVDRFGWSPRLGGANDYASMAAGNTSVFNCRTWSTAPGVRSPHSWGRSLDLNTWENPYRSAHRAGAQRLLAAPLAPALRLALPRPPGRRAAAAPRLPVDLRGRRHPALRRDPSLAASARGAG